MRSASRPLAILLAAALTACAPLVSVRVDSSSTNRIGPEARAAAPAQEGIARLKAGDPRAASAAFNAAIARSPRDAQLHLLNGLAYHLMYLSGSGEPPEVAETGYLTALRLDPANVLAMLQLGRLYVAMGRYGDAQSRYLDALAMKPEDARLWLELAAAEYAGGNVRRAAAALAAADSRRVARDGEYLRSAALIRAAEGDDAGARALVGELGAGAGAKLLVPLAERVDDWRNVHRMAAQIAQAPVTPAAPGGFPMLPSAAQAPQRPPPAASQLAPDWFDCRDAQSPGAAPMGMPYAGGAPMGIPYAGGSSMGLPYAGGDALRNEDFAALPALPSPCSGRPLPRMANIEAVLISYDEQASTSSGINILDSLQLVFSGSRSVQDSRIIDRLAGAAASSMSTTTIARSVGLPAAGVAYSLNIANATRQRNEIVSRPTLLVLDRKPSQAFSGLNLSVALQGNAISGGSIQEKAIGSGLAVTPTFVDDDRMLLAVRITNSGVVTGVGAGFGPGTLSTRRSSFIANALLSFDQTLVLSGIELMESQREKSGVPGLQDVPIAQYLFSNATGQERRLSALILLTPRRALPQPAPAEARGGSPWVLDQLARGAHSLPPAVRAALARLENMPLGNRIRRGDVRLESWTFRPGLDELLAHIARFLYY